MPTNIQVVQAAQQLRRQRRNPTHSFSIRYRPWHITPCLAAPVLPGETMDRCTFQARVVSDPVNSSLTGWWTEFWLFYVPHRAMAGSDDFQAMMLDLDKDMSAYKAGAEDTRTYTYNGGMEWVTQARDACVTEYFRDEGQSASDHVISNEPVAKINERTLFDSASLSSVFEVDEPEITVGVDDKFTATEVEQMMRNWELLRGGGLTDMSYEDYLAQHGVRQSVEVRNVPELLRYERQWTYPTNTIDPTDGSPSSAVSWSLSGSADKARLFKEPGIIIGLMASRPKVYRDSQNGAGVGMLDNALAWLPNMMMNDVGASYKTFASGAGPLQSVNAEYVVDVRDLFMYGDQFVNHARTGITYQNMVTLPDIDLNKEYPDSTDMDAVFVAPSGGRIMCDGVASFSIKGRVTDTSATVASTV